MKDILSSLLVIAQDVIPVGHAKIAAAIVYRKEVVAVGVCSYRTHPFQKKFGRNDASIHLHAEIDAILKAKRRGIPLTKCVMYIARAKRPSAYASEYIPGLAKPCSGCQRAIQEAGIKQIIYTED